MHIARDLGERRGMCGIVGVVRSEGFSPPEPQLQRALAAIRHRGPDDEGTWRENGTWLGHRRLSIIDLSPAGRQPIISACGRFVLAFNGEIYNYRELRACLERRATYAWRGTSDSEVLVELIAAHGVQGALERANGMFALAVWDRSEQSLHLARDRFGEKPLYYALRGGGFAFASELSALEELKDIGLTVSPETVALYFVRGYFPAPHSIYEHVFKVPPGCILTWRIGSQPTLKAYWSLEEVVNETREARRRKNGALDVGAAAEELDALIRKATAMRMVADVPVGVFLSGGVDSSMIAAAVQSAASAPITTFTLGFEDPRYDEAPHARAVAQHLGVRHIEETATAERALAIVGRLGRMLDEPLADDSHIPTYLVSEMARKHVTVALSGDGGDELFGGYRRYLGTPALWRRMRRLPMRSMAPSALRVLPVQAMDIGLWFLKDFAGKHGPTASVGRSLRRIAPWINASSLIDLHERSLEKWPRGETPLNGAAKAIPPWPDEMPGTDDEVDRLCFHDQRHFFPGGILTKVDRASMAVSLETRIPLLDPEIVRFAWSLPTEFRAGSGVGKRVLREALKRRVPPALTERPKTGFSPPLEAWLLGPLRGWAEDLLSPARLERQGLLDVRCVQAFWNRYKRGGTLEDSRAWALLSFQDWMSARGM